MKTIVQQKNDGGGEIGRPEFCLAFVLLGAALAFRVLFAFNYHVINDEPQHLHVVWGWAHGLMQYRDVFDNHMPLFHLLCSPVAALLGDRADLLILMRLAMLPLYGVSVFCAYLIGRAAFSKRAGLWAAVWVGLCYPLFSTWVQFRADDLWAMWWMACVAALLGGRFTKGRAVWAGLLASAALGTSLKTSFLLVALIVTVLLTILVTRRIFPWRRRGWHVLRCAGLFAACLAVIPVLLGSYFYFRGAFGWFWEGVIGHNMVAHLNNPFRNIGLVAAVSAGGIGAAALLAAINKHGAKVVRQVFLILLGCVSLAVLKMWPMVTEQDYLTVYPLFFIIGAGIAEGLGGRLLANNPRKEALIKYAVMPAVPVLQVLLLIIVARWHSEMTTSLQQWRDVLRLTDSNQTVMDAKGDLIFRQRGCRPVLEMVTAQRLSRGLLKDDIAEQLIASNTCVSVPTETKDDICRIPPRDQEFIRKNYISVGTLVVAGKLLDHLDRSGGQFTIAVPTRYAIIAPQGPAGGEIDGHPYGGPCMLEAGTHTYKAVDGETAVAVVWSQAIERGFWPVNFAKRPQE